MATALATEQAHHDYLPKVIERMLHHAPGVSEVFPKVYTAIQAYADPGSKLVRDQQGDLKNMGWFLKGGRRFAATYKHTGQCIAIHEGTIRGPVVVSFTNQNTFEEVAKAVAAL